VVGETGEGDAWVTLVVLVPVVEAAAAAAAGGCQLGSVITIVPVFNRAVELRDAAVPPPAVAFLPPPRRAAGRLLYAANVSVLSVSLV
jgi:hypothetical protein